MIGCIIAHKFAQSFKTPYLCAVQMSAVSASILPKHCIVITGTSTYKDRGSKFLGFAELILSEEEAKERITWYKKKYHDARHVCYAYRLGPDLWRTKDDGEPHGTAGLPILRAIDALKRDCCLVVVVRYFGGTLLGTGGLMVAYREAAKSALQKLEEETKKG